MFSLSVGLDVSLMISPHSTDILFVLYVAIGNILVSLLNLHIASKHPPFFTWCIITFSDKL